MRREVVDYFQTTGETRAVKRVELRAQVSGYLKEINFKDGELVEKDRLLFVIDPHRYQAAVNSAKANLLKADPTLRLEIAGHTDNAGSKEHNAQLSQGRADAVVAALVGQYGIAPGRLVAKGYGDSKPVAPNDNPAGMAKNRRVELRRL